MLLFQVSILGGASLNMEGDYSQIVAAEVIGDNSGRATVRRTQVYMNTQNRVLQEFSILGQRESAVALPMVVNCRGIDILNKGNLLY